MRMAPGTLYLDTVHAVRIVFQVKHAVLPNRLKKAWPAAGTGKFRVRPEELIPADRAIVGAFGVAIPVLAGKGSFGAFFPGYMI